MVEITENSQKGTQVMLSALRRAHSVHVHTLWVSRREAMMYLLGTQCPMKEERGGILALHSWSLTFSERMKTPGVSLSVIFHYVLCKVL